MPSRKSWSDWTARDSEPWRHGAGALGAALLALAAGCASFEHLTRVDETTLPRAVDCGECHIDITREWRASDHAAAFTNPHFQAATDDAQITRCLSCHAPQPGLTDEPPVLRPQEPNEGVTCVCCHLDQAAMVGPLRPTGKVQPHPVTVQPDRHRDSRLCGRCHEGTYRQWQQAVRPDKPSCQQCHMPAVDRKVTQSTGGVSKILVAMEKVASQRRHTFSIPTVADTAEAPVAATVQHHGDTVTVTLTNRLPHALPTGDFGFRVVEIVVEAENDPGHVTRLCQEEWTAEMKTALAAGAQWQRTFPVESVARLRLRLLRRSYADQPVLTLWAEEVTLP